MKTGLTEIVAILDKSGSMQGVRNDALGGINTFIEDQKKEDGEANFTLVTFDTISNKIFDRKNIKEVDILSEKDYVPGGDTALLDAVASQIDELGKILSETAEDDRPENVIFAILTDGAENASRKYTREQLMEKITHQTDAYKWEFIFLAANQDAIQAAADIGIAANHSMNYAATGLGTRSAYSTMNETVKLYRKSKSVDMAEAMKHVKTS